MKRGKMAYSEQAVEIPEVDDKQCCEHCYGFGHINFINESDEISQMECLYCKGTGKGEGK